MPYDLQAVIAADELLRAARHHLPAARSAPLGQGLALIPMTDTRLGASAHGAQDEFSAVGLARRRTGEAWLSADSAR